MPWTALALLPAAILGTLAAAFPSIGTEFVAMGCEQVGRVSLSAVEWAAARATGFETDARPAIPWCLGAAGIAIWVLRVRTTRMRVGLALAQSALLSFAPGPQIRPPPPRVVVFHVGQGDAILVQGRRAAVLIDAGTRIPGGVDRGHQTVIPGLAALGVRRLDLMIATHADLDHRGGLPEVLRAFPVGELWLPESGRDDAGFQELLAAARERGVPVLERGSASRPARFGDVLVTPLWPPPDLPLRMSPPRMSQPGVGGTLGRNDRSLVVAFDVGGRRVLIPGDLEASGEAALLQALLRGGDDLGADVLALPHHGSRTSSSRAFLRAVRPRVAVASAPCRGRFGMPHREVLDRARELGIPVWWTGRDGAVLIGLGDPLVAWGYSDLENSTDFEHVCRFPGNRSNR